MMRSSLGDAARRAYLGFTRATMVKADDKKKWQEISVKSIHGEEWKGVEVAHPYGFTSVPLPPKDGQEAEVLLAFVNGSRSHPIAIPTGDRRHRMKDMQEGETAFHDDQKQSVAIKRDVLQVTSPKKIVLAAVDGDGAVKCSITLTPDGKIVLKGEIHLGDDGGKLVHRKGDADSDGDLAVGAASKVYAV